MRRSWRRVGSQPKTRNAQLLPCPAPGTADVVFDDLRRECPFNRLGRFGRLQFYQMADQEAVQVVYSLLAPSDLPAEHPDYFVARFGMPLGDLGQPVGGRDARKLAVERVGEICGQGGNGCRADRTEDFGKLAQIPVVAFLVELVLHVQQRLDRLNRPELAQCPPRMDRCRTGRTAGQIALVFPNANNLDQRRHMLLRQAQFGHVVWHFLPSAKLGLAEREQPIQRRWV